MINVLKELSERKNADYSEKETTWINEDGSHLPAFVYKLNFYYESGKINLLYEFRSRGAYRHAFIPNQDVESDLHLCNIKCVLEGGNKLPEFSIERKGMFSKWFSKNNLLYQVKCKDADFKKELEKNSFIQKIYGIISERTTFECLITGKSENRKSNDYIIRMNYVYHKEVEIPIREFISFCERNR